MTSYKQYAKQRRRAERQKARDARSADRRRERDLTEAAIRAEIAATKRPDLERRVERGRQQAERLGKLTIVCILGGPALIILGALTHIGHGIPIIVGATLLVVAWAIEVFVE